MRNELVNPLAQRAFTKEDRSVQEEMALKYGTPYYRMKVCGIPNGQAKSLQDEMVSAFCSKGKNQRCSIDRRRRSRGKRGRWTPILAVA
jgi:hypothetical protein